MKKTLLIIWALLLAAFWVAAICEAGEVTLQWDANSENVDGYRLFWRIEGTTYDYERSVLPDNFQATTYTIKNLIPSATYYFVARAYRGENESGDSNEVTFVVPPVLYICRGCLLTATGERPSTITEGTYLIEGYPGLLAHIRPVPEDNDSPAYSVNSTRTIYHLPGCRYYNPDRGIADPVDCPTCRPCKICGVQ